MFCPIQFYILEESTGVGVTLFCVDRELFLRSRIAPNGLKNF